MKKLLYSSLILLIFSTSILIFNLSCEKEVNGQMNSETLSITNGKIKPTTTTGVIFFTKYDGTSHHIWRVNYDGTNETEIILNLGNLVLSWCGEPFLVSHDGKKLFISLRDPNVSRYFYIYSCNIDGSNLTKIYEGDLCLHSTQQITL